MVARSLVLAVVLAGCGVQTPKKIEWRTAAAGDVAVAVKREIEVAAGERRSVLVYVGAKWCEPCRRFHQAVEQGKLDSAFPGLRLIEFDLDSDRERLASAGYASRLIPLFALPAADGRASGKQMEGSVKGDGAVNEIVPRLGALLR